MACCSRAGIRKGAFSVPLLSPRSLLRPSRLLLALLRTALLAGQRFAHATRGTTHALLRFGFRFNRGNALRCSDMMLRDADPKMRGALLIAERATHGRGAQPLPARAFVHEASVHEQFVDIERRASV